MYRLLKSLVWRKIGAPHHVTIARSGQRCTKRRAVLILFASAKDMAPIPKHKEKPAGLSSCQGRAQAGNLYTSH